ncbi:MAG: hypothetical protein P4L46_19005 [Fimbriimonas sp.]|nr:hypothetical protein [Fimbriimonas sp.]
MQKAFVLVAVCAGILAVGCGNKDSQVIGKWNGKVILSDKDKKNPAVTAVEGMLNQSTFEFKSDHAFTASIGAAMEGTWKVEDTKVSLTPTKVAGKSIADIEKAMAGSPNYATIKANLDKPMTMTLSSDGKTLTMDSQSSATTSKMVFSKA